MFLMFQSYQGKDGDDSKVYQCVSCGNIISRSEFLLPINGRDSHKFINPAGVRCEFFTFHTCLATIINGEPTTEHTWFSEYSWSMAFCGGCFQHLGWFYESTSVENDPKTFWGILMEKIIELKIDNGQ